MSNASSKTASTAPPPTTTILHVTAPMVVVSGCWDRWAPSPHCTILEPIFGHRRRVVPQAKDSRLAEVVAPVPTLLWCVQERDFLVNLAKPQHVLNGTLSNFMWFRRVPDEFVGHEFLWDSWWIFLNPRIFLEAEISGVKFVESQISLQSLSEGNLHWYYGSWFLRSLVGLAHILEPWANLGGFVESQMSLWSISVRNLLWFCSWYFVSRFFG